MSRFNPAAQLAPTRLEPEVHSIPIRGLVSLVVACLPALIGATYVAASRLVDNGHFLSDVVFGAAIGQASGGTVVGRHGRNQYAMMRMPVRGGMMISITRVAD